MGEVEINDIDFNNKQHCSLIMVLAKQNKFFVDDLEFYVSKNLDSLTKLGISKTVNLQKIKIKNIFYADNENYKGFIMMINNKAIGFLIYYKVMDVYDNIHFLLIDKSYRKNGYGSLLLRYLILNTNTKFIKIHKPEPESLDFYKKSGFSNIIKLVKQKPSYELLTEMLMVSMKNAGYKFEDISPKTVISHLMNEPKTNMFILIKKTIFKQ